MGKEPGDTVYNDFSMLDRHREERALKRFKQAVEQLVTLLRVSTGSHTTYLYWVNRNRSQFVLETAVTHLDDVVFEDRVSFQDHFLKEWTNLSGITVLLKGDGFAAAEFRHHANPEYVKSAIIIPFINNGETVALTVIEQHHLQPLDEHQEQAVEAYQEALLNILQTYLELSDMLDEEGQWIDFNTILDSFSVRLTRYNMLDKLLAESAALTSQGGALLVMRGMNSWNAVLKSGDLGSSIRLGMKMSENSQVNRALKTGEAQFALHFNGNPKRLNATESGTDGASLAVPIDIRDRRQAVLLVWDENPLVFRESVKHMFKTLARVVGLQLSLPRYNISSKEDVAATDSGAYSSELLEHALGSQIRRYKLNMHVPTSWLVLISPKDYQNLRTRFRLERLKLLQSDMVNDLNPNHRGLSGFVSFLSDSLYAVYIQAEEAHLADWVKVFSEEIKEKSAKDHSYINGMDFFLSKTKLSFHNEDPYEIIQEAKQTFNTSVKDNITISSILNG